MIVATHLVKTFNNGHIQALNDVSLEIADGQFVAILGTSGSGKTTLLNILSGLETPDNGDVTVNGAELNRLTDRQLTLFRKENVGFVFQQYYLLPHLNVLANIRIGAHLVGNKEFQDIIDAMKISDKLQALPCELSGGEQQRVCIARALAKKPPILFLDEPTGALDETTGREVLDLLMKQKEKLGFTMIMVTHNRNIADMAQTVIKMNSGKIVETYVNKNPKTAYEIGW